MLELVVVVAGAAASAILVAVGRARQSKNPRDPEARAKLPVAWLLAGAGGLALAPVLGWTMAPRWVAHVASAVPGELVLTGVGDPWMARAYAFAAITTLVALPGSAFVVWLVASTRRSPIAALFFAGFTSLCGGLAVMLSWALHDMMLAALVDTSSLGAVPDIDVQFTLRAAVSSSTRLSLGLGVSGAAIGAVAAAAASSAKGLRIALWSTTGLPFGAALVSAVATPADLRSQLSIMVLVVAAWLLGLGLGAGLHRVLSRGSDRG